MFTEVLRVHCLLLLRFECETAVKCSSRSRRDAECLPVRSSHNKFKTSFYDIEIGLFRVSKTAEINNQMFFFCERTFL